MTADSHDELAAFADPTPEQEARAARLIAATRLTEAHARKAEQPASVLDAVFGPLRPHYERIKQLADNVKPVEPRSTVIPMGEPLNATRPIAHRSFVIRSNSGTRGPDNEPTMYTVCDCGTGYAWGHAATSAELDAWMADHEGFRRESDAMPAS